MINKFRWLIATIAIAIITACGGGGTNSVPTTKDNNNITPNIKQTGQTKSYDENGNEVTNGSVKDDGYYQIGKIPSYTRDIAKEVVIDNITGLMWQDNVEAKMVTKPWLTNGNYNTCHKDTTSPACNDTSGDTAAKYCEDLILGGYTDWRLPTIKELTLIRDRSRYNPTIDINSFQNVVSYDYWSSTTNVGYKDYAWVVDFDKGYDSFRAKANIAYVRCVRGNSLGTSFLIRDATKHTVQDLTTSLEWQDNETVSKSWRDAINYCENLTLGGYNDWRLPNINELNSIINKSSYNPAISSIFLYIVPSHYWSSTTKVSNKNRAWSVLFDDGKDYMGTKSLGSGYVRCVRTSN